MSYDVRLLWLHSVRCVLDTVFPTPIPLLPVELYNFIMNFLCLIVQHIWKLTSVFFKRRQKLVPWARMKPCMCICYSLPSEKIWTYSENQRCQRTKKHSLSGKANCAINKPKYVLFALVSISFTQNTVFKSLPFYDRKAYNHWSFFFLLKMQTFLFKRNMEKYGIGHS